MTKAQEQAQWRKEKTPVITEYVKTRKQAFSEVASRNFSYPPGFLYEWLTDAELSTKQKLTEINYQVLVQAVEREIKQAGIDYDVAYKNAAIAWEIEKESLLNNWERELALIKKGRADDERALDILALEVAKRSTTLIEQKTIIQRQAEAYRLAIEQLRGQTGQYEIQLAQAKIRTAEKKLEIIPLLEQLVVLEGRLIDKERQLVGKNQDIVSANEGIIDEQEILLDKEQQLVNKNSELMDAQEGVLSDKQALIAKQEDKVDAETDAIEAEEDYINARAAILEPALNSLISVFELLASELEVQSELYNQIATQRTETAEVESIGLDKADALLEQQRAISEAMARLIEQTNELIGYKVDVLGESLSNLVAAYELYEQAIIEQIAFENQIIEVKRQRVELGLTEVEKKAEISEIEQAIEDLRQSLVLAQTSRQQAKLLHQKVMVETDQDYMQTTMDRGIDAFNTVESVKTDAHFAIEALKVESAINSINASLSALRLTEGSLRSQDRQVEDTRAEQTKETAEIRAVSEITSDLRHVLSQ